MRQKSYNIIIDLVAMDFRVASKSHSVTSFVVMAQTQYMTTLNDLIVGACFRLYILHRESLYILCGFKGIFVRL